jgi:hypothetical protein
MRSDYATIGLHSAGEKVGVNFRAPFVAQLPALAGQLKAQFQGLCPTLTFTLTSLCSVLCCAVLCCAVRCCAVLCCAVLMCL